MFQAPSSAIINIKDKIYKMIRQMVHVTFPKKMKFHCIGVIYTDHFVNLI